MSTRRSFLASVVAGEVVTRVASALDAAKIAVMPLKGVLLQRWVYDDAAMRSLVDVDLLVRPRDFARAEAQLAAHGFALLGSEPGRWQTVWRHPELPLPVDLHRRLSRTRRHRLTPDAMFSAGRTDTRLFGAPVVLPDPLDLYAHLVAHGSTTFLMSDRLHRPEDLEAVARRFDLTPQGCADHLARRGMSRHARLLLPMARDACGDGFAGEALRRLPPDPVGQRVAAIARGGARGSARRRMAGWLLNPTVGDAAVALMDAAWMRIAPRGGAPSHHADAHGPGAQGGRPKRGC